MSSADRQVIEMANRPRQRLERMERMAKQARWRLAWRADIRRMAQLRKKRLREFAVNAAGAALVMIMLIGMVFAIVVC